MNVQNKIYIQPSWGLFIGKFDDNTFHKHYALQISIASQEPIKITNEHNDQMTYDICFINSNIRHQFQCHQSSLILLINPISSIGHQLQNRYNQAPIISAYEDLKSLTGVFYNYLNNHISFLDFTTSIEKILTIGHLKKRLD